VLRLNCFHHEAKSRFEGGELEPGSGEVGSGTGSAPECDLLTVTMANPGTGMCFEDVEDSGRLGHRLGNGAGPKKQESRSQRERMKSKEEQKSQVKSRVMAGKGCERGSVRVSKGGTSQVSPEKQSWGYTSMAVCLLL
jgi:hypothetical protein